jgi:hypothetical protein
MAKESVITLVAPALGLRRKAMEVGAEFLPADRTQVVAFHIQQRGGDACDAIPRLYYLLKTEQVYQVGELILHGSTPFTFLGRKTEMKQLGLAVWALPQVATQAQVYIERDFL